MARPKKPRMVDGTVLPENLYTDPKKRPNYWQYVRPDGTKKTIPNHTLEEAISLAEAANKKRDQFCHSKATPILARNSLARFAEQYIEKAEIKDPKLRSKQSWKDRKTYIRSFAKRFNHIPSNKLTLSDIEPWWEELTRSAQDARIRHFRLFFTMMAKLGAIPQIQENPFNVATGFKVLEHNAPKEKTRKRLTLDQYKWIKEQAEEDGYEFIALAMDLSLYTSFRRGDIVGLKWDINISNNSLCRTVSKAKEKGKIVNLRFDLDKHPELKEVVNRLRELSMKHRRCPYLVSHWYRKNNKSVVKDHPNQVLPKYLTDIFSDIVAKHPQLGLLPKKERPGFHEVRALSSHIMDELGFDISEVQEKLAHDDEAMTRHYQSGHTVQYTDVTCQISLPK